MKREEMIDAHIYDQEGNLQPFPMADTTFNRAFAEWLLKHDRYTVHDSAATLAGDDAGEQT